MNTSPVQLRFSCHNDPASFNDSLKEILDAIARQLPESPGKNDILKRSGWILMEFISNGYKHSGKNEVSLGVSIDDHNLVIVKEDQGSPLHLSLPHNESLRWPLNEAWLNKEIVLIEDSLHLLTAFISDEGTAVFSARSQDSNRPPSISELNEHFGLIIISSACNRFSYSFNEGRNTFKATIELSS